MDKLSIGNEMAQFDKKNRAFYDDLTDEEKKKFSTFLMIRYGSSVNGETDLQHFYLVSTNERLNKLCAILAWNYTALTPPPQRVPD